LVQDQGGRYIRTGGIRLYFEALNFASNAEIGPKDFFEIASIIANGDQALLPTKKAVPNRPCLFGSVEPFSW